MATFNAHAAGWTPIAHADGATALLSNSYHALRTTTASTLRVVEVFIGGEATASTVNRMALRRHATTATATPTNLTPAPSNTLSGASVSQSHVAATTGPTVSASGTQHQGDYSLNTFGGVVRWVAAPGEEIWATVGVVPNGELILDSVSGTGLVTTHMVFEEI